MTKIKCNVCSNEENGFCTVKKAKMHINKKRKCESYIYESSKLKIKQKIPSIRVPYTDLQSEKREAKKRLKELKELISNESKDNTVQQSGAIKTNDRYPLTGDLSRFTTTAAKGT